MSPARAFATVFMAVFLFIFIASTLVTFMLPETYRASARVLAPGAAHLRAFQSAELLREVSRQLHLPETFAAGYGESKPLEEERVQDLLRRAVQVRRLAGTDLVEIRVYGRSPAECAQLANAIAETGAQPARSGSGSDSLKIVDRAVPPLKPARPNKPLNLALGAVVGVFLGTMAGGVGAKLAVGFDGQGPKSA